MDEDDNDGDDANDARITRDIQPGTYTVAVTTRSSNRTGSYTLKIKQLQCENPTNFRVTRASASTANLTWTARDDSMTPIGYYVSVYRHGSSGWVQDDTLRPSATATSFTDSGLLENSWYAYKMWAQCGPTQYSSGLDWFYLGPWSDGSGTSGSSGSSGEPPETVPTDAP